VPRRRFNPYALGVLLDDLLTDGQPNARSSVFVASMQALEHAEDPLEILRIDADAIIGDRKNVAVGGVNGGRDVDPRRRRSMILDRIADQVLE
jgi:hypothetical protein